MPRGRTNPVMLTRVRGDVRNRMPDKVVAEEPMEVRLDDHLVTTTMRTPGHDYELAVGFLFTEGLLAGAPVHQVRYCATGSAVDTEFNIVSVDTGGKAPVPQARLGTTTSSCGLCGSVSIDSLAERLTPVRGAEVDVALVAGVAERVREAQDLFAATGSVHAAASYALDSGAVGVMREDVGRHNAVDKVVGRLLLDDALATTASSGLFVSGRISFEIVQKAWAAGFAQVVGVSGPTGLAVDTARRAGIALAGFLRNAGANLYT